MDRGSKPQVSPPGGQEARPVALLVLGMHRSGTSALTRTVSLLGADLPDNLIPPRPANETGFWESVDIQTLNDRLLAALGSRWDDWRPLHLDALPASVFGAFRDEAVALLRRQFASSELFVLKDPRICRLLPFWRAALEAFGAEARCLIPLRSPVEVAASLEQRNGLRPEAGHMLWLRYVLDAEFASRDLPRVFLSYDQLLNDWRAALDRISRRLTLRFPRSLDAAASDIEGFLRPDLRHHDADVQSPAVATRLADWVQETADVLCDASLSDTAELPTVRGHLDRVRTEVDRATTTLLPLMEHAPAAPKAASHAAKLDPDSGEAAALRLGEASLAAARAALAGIGGTVGRFSVILPTWNRRDTLEEAVTSVVAQTYRDWELIVCDDGSTDDSESLLSARFADEIADGRIRYLRLTHGGVGAARNAGLRAAGGEWIAYLDSDNRWHPDYLLMTAAGYATQRHRRTAYACMHVHDEAEGSEFIRCLPYLGWSRLLAGNFIDLNVFSHHRDLYRQLGGFDETLRRLVDWDLILRYARLYEPLFNPYILHDYFVARRLGNITLTEPLDAAEAAVRRKFQNEADKAPETSRPRLACLLPAWPSRPDDPALESIKVLEQQHGIAVRAYYLDGTDDAATQLPEVPVLKANDTADLAALIAGEARDASAHATAEREAAAKAAEISRQRLRAKDAQIGKLDASLQDHRQRIEALTTEMEQVRAALREAQTRQSELEGRARREEQKQRQAHTTLKQGTALLASQRKRAAAQLADRVVSLRHQYAGRQQTPRLPPPARLLGEALGPRTRLRLLREARRLMAARLFDPEWYLLRYPDIARHDVHPLWHWLLTGWREGREPNPVFHSGWYLQRHPDVAASGVNPLLHYLESGAQEGRSASPLFDSSWYLATHPDVAQAKMNPMAHFLAFGEAEGRNPHPLIDQRWYAERNADVTDSGVNALRHFLLLGGLDGRSPGPDFDSAWYLSEYPDVLRAGMNPLVHYLCHGRAEGRRPSPTAEAGSSVAFTPTDGEAHHRPAMPPAQRFAGAKTALPGQRNVLLCAHTGSGHLFGGERSFLDLLELLDNTPYNVYVIVPHADEAYIRALAERAVEVAHVPYRFWQENEATDARAVASVMALLAEHAIDVVHVNTMIIREPLIAARRLGIPAVVHVRESVTADRWMSERIGLPPARIIDTVRESADCIIANSKQAAVEFDKPGHTFVVPNTFDLDRLDLPNRIDADEIRIGLISSNLPKKGIEDFALLATACAEEIPNLRFVLIGPDNGHITALRERQRSGEITPRLQFLGYQNTPEEAMAHVNIVASLSHFAESFGRTVAEGLAARRPALVYDLGAPKELVQQEQSGFVIPYGQWQEAIPLLKALCSAPERILRMGECGRAFIAEHYGREQGRTALLTAYGRALVHAPPAAGKRRIAAARNATVRAEREPAQPRLAYFCWHFPVPSETFVLNELRLLVSKGWDVEVFCRQSPYPDFQPDFPIRWQRVADPQELAEKLRGTGRKLVHAHFTYPTVTEMVWPACEEAGIPFTFIAHAQDIFKHDNDRRNRVGEVARSPSCRAVFTLGRFHRDYLAERGVPREKIIINPNSIDPTLFPWAEPSVWRNGEQRKVCAIHRLTEKKGLHHLIDAAARMQDENIVFNIYGYGDDEPRLRKLIEERGLDNVHILGPLRSREAIIEVLRSHHLFASPSVRTDSGDMDGIPTVLIESMAVGTPVITTDVASIPDLVQDGVTGIVTPPDDAQALADGIRRFFAMDEGSVLGISMNGRDAVEDNHDARRTTRTLERVWTGETIDLVIVSWNGLPELREVIGRIYDHTRTPFHLTVCDNGSEPDVLMHLSALHTQHDNITVVFNGENSYVGPGTNIAAAQGSSEHIIYLCGKEGFVLAEGWERQMLAYMEEHPEVGLAGTLGYSPSYYTGAEMEKNIPTFANFRNPQFARDNPDRPFHHVQGGLFIMRRKMFDEIGGFSVDVPHAHTDVEYSYYAESMGWGLGQVPGMLALYNKTRPDIWSRIDERVRVCHPPTLQDLPLLDSIVSRQTRFCNICGWAGTQFIRRNQRATCPSCGSEPAHRTIYRWIADSDLSYRRLPALYVNPHPCLQDFWSEAFDGLSISCDNLLSDRGGNTTRPGARLVAYHLNTSPGPLGDREREVLESVTSTMSRSSTLLLHLPQASTGVSGGVIRALREFGLRSCGELHYLSASLAMDGGSVTAWRCCGAAADRPTNDVRRRRTP